MRRLLAISFAIPVALMLQAGSVEASGGGGCGNPVSEDAGNAVSIELFCFEPTILYASPGEDITWTNNDSVPHNVQGANFAWGSYDPVRRGASDAYAFDEAGVYPYVCAYHPGMTGAIVVGDAGIERLDIAPVARVRAGGQPFQSGHGASGVGVFALVAAVALMALFVIGMVRAQRRSKGS